LQTNQGSRFAETVSHETGRFEDYYRFGLDLPERKELRPGFWLIAAHIVPFGIQVLW